MKRLTVTLAVLLTLVVPMGLVAVPLLAGPALAACAPAHAPAGVTDGTPVVPETTRVVMPLPAGSYSISDSYGWRTDPFTGERAFHQGTDFPAADGTPILATADGLVVLAGYDSSWGNIIVLEHTVDGQRVASVYLHMWDTGIHVSPGQIVRAGDWIGDVGSSGHSTGPHLHFEIRPGGWGHDTINSLTWLTEHHAEGIDAAVGGGQPACKSPTPSPTPTPSPSGTATP
ncbi:MAG: M23 family metallopeptidase [Salinibacterium sp.]|nr:M23 family metallopeptidase [Salinibacterium sp.]